MKRKGRRADVVPPAARALECSTGESVAYPSIGALPEGLVARARGLCLRLVLGGAAVGVGIGASGCEPPSCQPTRLDEVKVHGDNALGDVGRFELKEAASELGVGFGVVPHPYISAPGEMIPVSATPPVPVPVPEPADS